MSNLVSSASLRGEVFVVVRPCQPPPVKNMGPLNTQVRLYLRDGVERDTEGIIYILLSPLLSPSLSPSILSSPLRRPGEEGSEVASERDVGDGGAV